MTLVRTATQPPAAAAELVEDSCQRFTSIAQATRPHRFDLLVLSSTVSTTHDTRSASSDGTVERTPLYTVKARRPSIETHTRVKCALYRRNTRSEASSRCDGQTVNQPTSDPPPLCYYLFDTRHGHAPALCYDLQLDPIQPVCQQIRQNTY